MTQNNDTTATATTVLGQQLAAALDTVAKPAAATTKVSAKAPRAPKTIRVPRVKPVAKVEEVKSKGTKGTNKKEDGMKKVNAVNANNMGIGDLANKLLEHGYSTKDTLANIQACFPGCKTTMKCIYYYASKNPKVNLSRKQTVNDKELRKVLAGLK